jgi:predicted nucleic acid-binding protein
MPIALLDTNVLVHAAFVESALHTAAATLVDRGLRRRGLYCVSPQNLVEFSAVVTRGRSVTVPMSGPEVSRMTELFYRSRRLTKIYPQRGTVIRAVRHGTALGVTGPRWYDLYLAMTMADAGVGIIITDNAADFRQFPFIRAQTIQQAL